MKRFCLLLLPLGLFVGLPGCSDSETSTPGDTTSADVPTPSDDTAAAALQAVMDGMKAGQPVVIWNSLPEKHQKDVNDIVRSFAVTMDANTWNTAVGILGGVHKVFDEKGDFFANSAMMLGGGDPESTRKAIPKVAAVLKAIIDGAGDLEKLESFDGGEFLSTTGSSVAAEVTALAAMAPQQPGQPNPFAIADATIETLESTDTSAKLKITADGQEEQVVQFMKVDGKWLPLEMAMGWDEKVSTTKLQIKNLPNKLPQINGQVTMFAGMANGILSPLQSAETQEQFDSALGGMMGMLMPMMMGGGGPPPGFNAAPPAASPGESSPGESSPGDAPASQESQAEPVPAGAPEQ